MSLSKLQEAFISALRVRPGCEFEALSRKISSEWDSIAHMELVSELERTFGISLTDNDVLEMNDFAAARQILIQHGVNLDG